MSFNSIKIQENIPLAPLTTFKIGGPARFFVRAESENAVLAAVAHARTNGLELFVLGGGSNILVADSGFDGLVLQMAVKGIERSGPQNQDSARIFVTAQAGEDWDSFVGYCVDAKLAGVECLSGIPGFVGGTPIQNVGAYGQEVSESIVTVRCLDRSTGEITELSNQECGFAYRKSVLNSTERDRYIVLSVTFALEPGGQPKLVYKDLKEHFSGRRPTLAETRLAVIDIRSAKSMVIDAADPNSQSAGSFFKNPITDPARLAKIARAASVDAVPHFDAGGGMVKIPAAWLIERAGFPKGFVLGNAGISANHSLALINRGGATARDILELKRMIVERVNYLFGIELTPEPIFVGPLPGEGHANIT